MISGTVNSDLDATIPLAMEFHIEGMRSHGEPVPEPSVEAGKFAVSIP